MTTTMSACCFRSSMNCWGNRAIGKVQSAKCRVPAHEATWVALSFFQIHDRSPSASLLFRRRFETCDERVILEIARYGPAKLTGTVSMDDSELADIGHGYLIEELVKAIHCLVNRRADEIQFAERAFPRLQVHADPHRWPRRRSGDGTQVAKHCAQPFAADVYFCVLVVNLDHHAFETERANRNP